MNWYVLPLLFPWLIVPKFKLISYQVKIGSFQSNKFFVSAQFNHFTFLQNNHLIGVFYRAQSVSHNDYSFIFKHPIQVVHNRALICGIQCIGSFVEKYHIGVFIDRPGDKNSLLLTLAKTRPLTTDPGAKTER